MIRRWCPWREIKSYSSSFGEVVYGEGSPRLRQNWSVPGVFDGPTSPERDEEKLGGVEPALIASLEEQMVVQPQPQHQQEEGATTKTTKKKPPEENTKLERTESRRFMDGTEEVEKATKRLPSGKVTLRFFRQEI